MLGLDLLADQPINACRNDKTNSPQRRIGLEDQMRQTTVVRISAAFGLCCLTAAVSTAYAADMPAPVYKAPPAVPAPVYSWTGFYAGVHGGYGGTWISGTGPGGSAAGIQHGFIAGGQVGYNYQIRSFVVGLEGDLSWSAVDLQAKVSGGRVTIKDRYFATIGPRLGYALEHFSLLGHSFDHTLLYVKGGAAFTQEDWRLTSLGQAAIGTFNRTGWMLGTGAEYPLWNGWTLKAEYNYLNFASIHEVLHRTTAGAPVIIGDVKASSHLGKFGINYRF
jgi:outer membrane immunogenic protein